MGYSCRFVLTQPTQSQVNSGERRDVYVSHDTSTLMRFRVVLSPERAFSPDERRVQWQLVVLWNWAIPEIQDSLAHLGGGNMSRAPCGVI